MKDRPLKPGELDILGRYYHAREACLGGWRETSWIADSGLTHQEDYDLCTLNLMGLVYIVGEYFVPVKKFAISTKGIRAWEREGMAQDKRLAKWNAAVRGKA
jgi:hypothetical protein